MPGCYGFVTDVGAKSYEADTHFNEVEAELAPKPLDSFQYASIKLFLKLIIYFW